MRTNVDDSPCAAGCAIARFVGRSCRNRWSDSTPDKMGTELNRGSAMVMDAEPLLDATELLLLPLFPVAVVAERVKDVPSATALLLRADAAREDPLLDESDADRWCEGWR